MNTHILNELGDIYEILFEKIIIKNQISEEYPALFRWLSFLKYKLVFTI